jgi:hypothetical protein
MSLGDPRCLLPWQSRDAVATLIEHLRQIWEWAALSARHLQIMGND